MRSILCYGDSNTWGCSDLERGRHGRWVRWPGVLQRELGVSFYVIEEGLNGRTSAFDVPDQGDRNGLAYLPTCLDTHAPLDIVVLALGVNDVFFPGVDAYQSAEGVRRLIETVQASEFGPAGRSPDVLVVAPPPIVPKGLWLPQEIPAAEASREFGTAFRALADATGCAILDLDGIAAPSELDGVHFDDAGHEAIGLAVASSVRYLLYADRTHADSSARTSGSRPSS
jgi:lysophospholipase L1-like esterase